MSDNSDPSAKVAIRKWALAQVGDKKAAVLELFGGEGNMHDACYKGVAKHLAFDLKGVERGTWLQGDNRVLLQQHVNAGWSLYDADAYSNPWIILSDICRLREASKTPFAFVATCYCKKGIDWGNPGAFFRWVTGYGQMPKCPALLGRFYDDYIRSVWRLWAKYGVEIQACKRVRSTRGAELYYYGLLVRKA